MRADIVQRPERIGPWLGAAALLAVAACRTGPPPPPPVPPSAAESPSIHPDPPAAEPAGPEDIGGGLAAIAKQTEVPGLGGAVFDRTSTIAIGVAGVRRADQADPLTTDDRFHLGSDTKAMTAYVVGRLVDQGTLSWDDTLIELFPDGESFIDPAYRSVTIDQLLTHRAGMPANALWAALNKSLDPQAPPFEHRLAVARFALARAPDHPPGDAFAYSNLGYTVLGAALHARTGDTWEQLIERELFEPLHMTSCGYGAVSTPDRPDGNWGHARHPEGYRPIEFDNPLYMSPAGTVHCSLEDWGQFARAMFDDSPGLSAATLEHLRTPIPDERAYARGWLVSDAFPLGETIITHDGSNTYNYASIVIAPQRGLAFVAASNAGDKPAQAAVVQVVRALMDRYGKPAESAQTAPE